MRRVFHTPLVISLAPLVTPTPKYAWDKLHGIDWGINDGTIGTWMGIQRTWRPMWHPHPVQAAFMLKDIPVVPYSGVPRNTIMVLPKEWAELIKKLQEDK